MKKYLTSSRLSPLVFCLVAACGGTTTSLDNGDNHAKKGDLTVGAPGPEGQKDTSAAWAQIQACPDNVESASIEVDSIALVGTELSVAVGYGGGCEKHDFALCYGEQWAESYPVQVGVRVIHRTPGDPCDAYLQQELKFSLEPLIDAYRKSYQTEEGAIKLGLDDKSVILEFGKTAAVPSWESINETIDKLNSCQVVEDCRPISSGNCSTAYVNQDADTTQLEADIQARVKAEQTDDVGCLAICQCGILSCDAGVCQTREGDCETAPVGEQMVCL